MTRILIYQELQIELETGSSKDLEIRIGGLSGWLCEFSCGKTDTRD